MARINLQILAKFIDLYATIHGKCFLAEIKFPLERQYEKKIITLYFKSL